MGCKSWNQGLNQGCLEAEPSSGGCCPMWLHSQPQLIDWSRSGHLSQARSDSHWNFQLGLRDTGQPLLGSWTGMWWTPCNWEGGYGDVRARAWGGRGSWCVDRENKGESGGNRDEGKERQAVREPEICTREAAWAPNPFSVSGSNPIQGPNWASAFRFLLGNTSESLIPTPLFFLNLLLSGFFLLVLVTERAFVTES